MRFLKLGLVLTAMIMNSNCKIETNQNKIEEKVIQKKKVITTKNENVNILKASDSITSKNAIDFLIAYGKKHKENKVLFKTRLGNILIKLYDDTPLHRANFIFLTEVGYFNTTCFNRVVPDFIAQGGNSENPSTLRFRNKYQNYTIPPEFRKNRKHKYGALSAARDWENNISKKSNPFEFFFVQAKQGAHHLDGEHTVFGEIISGFSVLNKIANLKAGRDEWPYKDVYIEAEVVK